MVTRKVELTEEQNKTLDALGLQMLRLIGQPQKLLVFLCGQAPVPAPAHQLPVPLRLLAR